MTPKTFFREAKAAELRAEDRLRELTTQAWQTCRVYFETQSKKKMPALKKLLDEIGGPKRGERQSLAGMKAALHIISEQHGIPLRRAAR